MLASIAERKQFRGLSAAKVRNLLELLCDCGVKLTKFLHSLTLCLSGTSALVLALRGVEGVAQRDVQTMVAAHSVLRVLITATVQVYGLNTTLQHVPMQQGQSMTAR